VQNTGLQFIQYTDKTVQKREQAFARSLDVKISYAA
jgi:hypothetical protein